MCFHIFIAFKTLLSSHSDAGTFFQAQQFIENYATKYLCHVSRSIAVPYNLWHCSSPDLIHFGLLLGPAQCSCLGGAFVMCLWQGLLNGF